MDETLQVCLRSSRNHRNRMRLFLPTQHAAILAPTRLAPGRQWDASVP